MGGMISVEEARRRVLDMVAVLDTVELPLEECLGLFLAEEVFSSVDLPPFDNSAMDGYAVRAADVAGADRGSPVRLEVLEDLPAGYVAESEVGPGQSVRIMTGAPLPGGADTVVPVEDTSREGSGVLVSCPWERGANVRKAGEEMRAGDAALPAGRRVGPAEMGVLAALGIYRPRVKRRPRAVVLSTGDELLDPQEELRPGKIRDTNSYTIAALAREAGAEVRRLGIVRDRAEELRRALQDNLEQADLFITSGGVSVGDYDLVKQVLAELGDMDFWKVNMRPGKPQAFGNIGGRPLFGLPGNPVSVMVSFEQFVRPALRKMMGAGELLRPMLEAVVEEPMGRSAGRVEFVRVVLRREGGEMLARPTGPQGSGILRSMVLGHGLAVLGEEVGRLQPGQRVTVQVLRAEPEAWAD
jgi:molybdopterin molybdotransferase